MSNERRPYLDAPEGELKPKQVSSKAYGRLAVAADAIAATKHAIAHQGNQVPSLVATKMNSQYRLMVMRDPSCWEYTTPESRQLAQDNPEADVAAKADLAHGGNCGEHAWVAYHYLRLHAKGQPIQYSSKEGLDHAFVLMGDLKNDKDNEIAVSDPWPNKPTACLWEDHFAYTADRTQINDYSHMVADGKSFKAAILAGLKLSARGEQMVKQAESEKDTKDKTDHWHDNHYWLQDDTVIDDDHKFKYEETKPPAAEQPRAEVH